MSKLCLNCNRSVSDRREFCIQCEENLEEMIDHRDVERDFSNQMEMRDDTNPFFSSPSTTGKVIKSDNDRISSRVNHTEESGDDFWMILLILILIMTVMVVIFL